MVEPILIASDLTSRSDRVVRRSRLIGGPLILVHVVEDEARLDERTCSRLKQIAYEDLADAEPVSDILIVAGRVPDTIARLAAEHGCRLIAAGIASFDSPKDYILGTTVDFLVRRATVPVLIVKRQPRAQYGSLVVATDFSQCSRRALETAAELFPDAQLRLLHAFSPPFPTRVDPAETIPFIRGEREEQMHEFLGFLPSHVRERVQPEIVVSALEAAIDDHRAGGRCDLLVVGTHGRSGVDHALFGGRASALLTSSLSDVLMVREM